MHTTEMIAMSFLDSYMKNDVKMILCYNCVHFKYVNSLGAMSPRIALYCIYPFL